MIRYFTDFSMYNYLHLLLPRLVSHHCYIVELPVMSCYFMVRKAKKEGNPEVVNQLETTLKIAMREREKTLRPEIQLLNQVCCVSIFKVTFEESK